MGNDTQTTTLAEFLLARITEDEAVARNELDHGDGEQFWGDWLPTHVTRFDPARVLAECEAKRRIVEQLQRQERLVVANSEKHTEASRGGIENQAQITSLRTHGWELSGRREALRMAVDALAAVYADHPDYDPA